MVGRTQTHRDCPTRNRLLSCLLLALAAAGATVVVVAGAVFLAAAAFRYARTRLRRRA